MYNYIASHPLWHGSNVVTAMSTAAMSGPYPRASAAKTASSVGVMLTPIPLQPFRAPLATQILPSL